MDLSLSFHMITPIRHMEVTDHVICPFYSYMIYGQSLDLLLLVIPHDLIKLCW